VTERSPLPAPIALDDTRERVVARLTESFARDALSLELFEHRLAAAYDAGTVAALDALVADLPAAAVEAPPLRIGAVLSNLARGAIRSLPRDIEIRAWLGNVELDFSGAELAPGITVIALRNVMGNIEIRLPSHVRVENRASLFLGNFECREQGGAGSADPRDTVVRFTGRVTLGSVTVTVV
jgi:hypothetical protein